MFLSFEASSIMRNVAHVCCGASAPRPTGSASLKTMAIAEEAKIRQQSCFRQRVEDNAFHLHGNSIVPSLFHSCDERFGFWKNHRLTCVLPGKFCHCIHCIEAE